MTVHPLTSEQKDALLGDRKSASGGGFPLPEALRAVLAFLHDNGEAGESVLHRVIREQHHVEFKEKRILEVWRTWDDFCSVILSMLADGGFIIPRERDFWVLGEKSVPGKLLMILRDTRDGDDRRIRVVFHGEQDRQEREEMQLVKNEVDDLISRISGRSDPAYEKVYQYFLACSQVLRGAIQGESDEEGENPVRSRRTKGQAAWYRDWMRTAGWHTQEQARVAWNEEHPEMFLENVSQTSFRNLARYLQQTGEMKVRPVRYERKHRRDPYIEHRWLGD